MKNLIVRLAMEIRWGYGKIEGELLRLGFKISPTTIRNALNRNGIVPSPIRNGSSGVHAILTLPKAPNANAYKDSL